jgi:hypothetical protein
MDDVYAGVKRCMVFVFRLPNLIAVFHHPTGEIIKNIQTGNFSEVLQQSQSQIL